MKGIVIAAGRGSRMGRLTADRPKCLLPIDAEGRTLFERTLEHLRDAGCREVVVVVGYRAERIPSDGIVAVSNPDFERNNILHSLMCAREHLRGPLLVTYSDVWVEPWIHRVLAQSSSPIALAVDRDWRAYYEGRRAHPVAEAEKVHFDASGRAVRIGKQLEAEPREKGLSCGEFLGLWRMSAEGTARFAALFDALDARLAPDAPFQNAAAWRRAYVTDLLQELVDRGERIESVLVERGWAELDTVEDYRRLADVARRQRLWSLCGELHP